MNGKQILMQQLQNQLSKMNPKVYQQFMQMQNQNPHDILRDIMSKYTPEKLEQFKQYLTGFGIREEQLQQYGINTVKCVDID